MLSIWKDILWSQFGASIDMLRNAIEACPEEVWFKKTTRHDYWYWTYHTLFWTDFYLSESPEGFTPPEPFSTQEMDPKGGMPEQPYSKEELLNYLQYCRTKCRVRIDSLTEEKAAQHFRFNWMDMSILELMLYNMRHVQHHTAQLNLLLRQEIDKSPGWVGRARE